ncbi:hypothetical protein [Streptomyces sp. SM1]|uniref:hypothetical protein n=1 Tax=Streptomyces sp. SM1 TaxID=402229 RepID=UPI0011B067F1|nr:hypothetical protein [Streptomyces sp. SM1]
MALTCPLGQVTSRWSKPMMKFSRPNPSLARCCGVVLRGGAGRKRPDQSDAMQAGGGVQAGHGGVAAVDQVPVRQQAQPPEAGVDAGQRLTVRAGDGGGHVGDDVDPLVVAGLGHVREVAGPAGVAAARPARLGLIRRLDLNPGGWPAVAHRARPEPPLGIHQDVLHQDRSEHLRLRRSAAGEPGVKALQQFAGVVAHLLLAGGGVAGLGAQANRPAVALGPFGGDQLI